VDLVAVILIYWNHDRPYFTRNPPKNKKIIDGAIIAEGLVILALLIFLIYIISQVVVSYSVCKGNYCNCFKSSQGALTPCITDTDCGSNGFGSEGFVSSGSYSAFNDYYTDKICVTGISVSGPVSVCAQVISGRCHYASGSNTQIIFNNDTTNSNPYSSGVCNFYEEEQCLNKGAGIPDVFVMAVVLFSILQRWIWMLLCYDIVPMLAPATIYYFKLYKGKDSDVASKNETVRNKVIQLERLKSVDNNEEEGLKNDYGDNNGDNGDNGVSINDGDNTEDNNDGDKEPDYHQLPADE